MNQGKKKLHESTLITFEASSKIVGHKNLTIEVKRKQDALALAQLMWDIYLEDKREDGQNNANSTINKSYN